MGKPPHVTSRPGQLSLLLSAELEVNTQPECDNVLLLVSKGRRGSFYLWMHVWMAGKTVTRAIQKRFVASQNQSKCIDTNVLFTLQNTDRWSHWAILWRCGKNHRCKNFEIRTKKTFKKYTHDINENSHKHYFLNSNA